MSKSTIFRAAARMTPRMALHQAKRLARNRIVPRIAGRYQQRIEADAGRLPLPSAPERIPHALAAFIGTFYREDAHAMDDAARGRFTLLGKTVDFGSIGAIDWDHKLPEEADHNLWRMKLTQTEIVHSLLASGEPERQQIAVQLLDGIDRHRSFTSAAAFKTAWAPYGVSHRLLAMLSGLALAPRVTGEAHAAIGRFARLDAAFLWQNIEHDLRNNHTERNLAAVCLYHIAADAIAPGQARSLDRDIAALVEATVLPDGTQIERSAMYQGLTVMSLRIFAATPFLSASTRALAAERGGAAEAAWAFLTHEDGDIALFNDAWVGEMPSPAEILGGVPATVPAALPDGGYFRVGSGGVRALMDAGEIGPRWNPGHGHADFLALEVDVDGRRFLVDPGTSQYSTGERRSFERAAASHNGPRYAGTEPVEYSGCFKVGRLAAARPIDVGELGVAAIGGVLETAAGRVARIVAALPEGGLLVVDRWSASSVAGLVTLLMPQDWQIEKAGAELRARDGSVGIAVLRGRANDPAEASWCRYFMAPEPAITTTLRAEPAPEGGQVAAFAIGARERVVPEDLFGRINDAARCAVAG